MLTLVETNLVLFQIGIWNLNFWPDYSGIGPSSIGHSGGLWAFFWIGCSPSIVTMRYQWDSIFTSPSKGFHDLAWHSQRNVVKLVARISQLSQRSHDRRGVLHIVLERHNNKPPYWATLLLLLSSAGREREGEGENGSWHLYKANTTTTTI